MKRNTRLTKGKRAAPGCPLIVGKLGYQFVADGNDAQTRDWVEVMRSMDICGWVALARSLASETLREERVLDWTRWVDRAADLSPPAVSAVFLMESASELETAISNEDLDAALIAAFHIGRLYAEQEAQHEWARRNPPPSANAKRKANADARRASMADYIRDKGERPDKRPGDWYAGFREAYPERAVTGKAKRAVTDRTLKADYPHALAIVRKQAKKGSTKRS